MSTTTSVRPPSGEAAPAKRPQYRVTGRRVVRSEWSKLWSLRSTWITVALALLFLVAFGIIAAARYKSSVTSGRQLDPDFADATALSLSLFGVPIAQLALGVLGVLVTAGEYSTGTIRSTLAAVPRRLPVLWSKALVFGSVALVLSVVGVVVTFLIGSNIVSGTPAALTFSSGGVLRSLLGAAFYLGLVGVIGAALGVLLRSVAGGISVLIAALMLIPGLISLLPKSWHQAVQPYLPSVAGQSMFDLHHLPHTLTPAVGLLVFVAWTVVALAGAAWRLASKDA
ncbi:MAG: type transport system permease protein [Kribbellaceae bacterium]|jgi:ABC-type transport system involved in multi-copper enzyme maturation permease subunit|nr:type transport system permease protein [Kribbellaceae bacterium]